MISTRPATALALGVSAVLLLGACSSQTAAPANNPASASATTVTIQDNAGSHTITTPPRAVVATDNRLFETLQAWDVKLAAAPKNLIPATIAYRTDESIVNLGSHNEPNLEAVVAGNPDLVINGNRFARYQDDFKKLAPNASVITLDPREGQPLMDELKRGTTVLGEVFGKKAEAAKLTGDLDASIARAKAAYKPTDTVMAVNVSGGKIGYIAPKVGRTLGPVFDVVGLTPALQVAGASDDHQGDDISVEAIAASNPDWILVLDRDAAIVTDGSAKKASEILTATEALKNVPAVKNGQIVYMPADTYTNEGIQTYTEFLSAFAQALEAKKGQ